MEFGGYSHDETTMKEIENLTNYVSEDNAFKDYSEKDNQNETNETEHTKKIDLESSIKRKVINEIIGQLQDMIENDDPPRVQKNKQVRKQIKNMRKVNKF